MHIPVLSGSLSPEEKFRPVVSVTVVGAFKVDTVGDTTVVSCVIALLLLVTQVISEMREDHYMSHCHRSSYT